MNRKKNRYFQRQSLPNCNHFVRIERWIFFSVGVTVKLTVPMAQTNATAVKKRTVNRTSLPATTLSVFQKCSSATRTWTASMGRTKWLVCPPRCTTQPIRRPKWSVLRATAISVTMALNAFCPHSCATENVTVSTVLMKKGRTVKHRAVLSNVNIHKCKFSYFGVFFLCLMNEWQVMWQQHQMLGGRTVVRQSTGLRRREWRGLALWRQNVWPQLHLFSRLSQLTWRCCVHLPASFTLAGLRLAL